MNFRYMPELEWRWGYPVLWAVMGSAAFSLLLWFRRRGWLGTSGHLHDGPEPTRES